MKIMVVKDIEREDVDFYCRVSTTRSGFVQEKWLRDLNQVCWQDAEISSTMRNGKNLTKKKIKKSCRYSIFKSLICDHTVVEKKKKSWTKIYQQYSLELKQMRENYIAKVC